MITEDYVSFKIAKLLKEKGFPQELGEVKNILPYYTDNGYLNKNDIGTVFQRSYCAAAAPSLSITMKWLREVHHLHITVFSSSQESWMYRITKPHQKLEDGKYGEDFNSYEKTAEEAIKYCLTNLI